jgi:peptide/nickel transport system ATP-binding protein
MSAPVLCCRNLVKRFGPITALDGVSLALHPGRITAIVGGSGSGKSTLANLLLGLESPTAGAVLFEGADIAMLRGTAHRVFRAGVQMVFQDPFASLNPRMTVGEAVREPLAIHSRGSRAEQNARVIAAFEEAGLQPAARFLGRWPHELSGGQRQRVAIARAMVLEPRVLIADEPVSMLDVSVRAGILALLRDVCRYKNTAIAFITHDLSLVGALAHDVAVMNKGIIVEDGPARTVLESPRSDYARRLLAAVPRLNAEPES